MSFPTILCLLIVSAVIAWCFGSIALRAFGSLLIVLGLLNLGLGTDIGLLASLLVILVGYGLWLTGHWLFAVKHHVFISALARRVFETVLPAALNPTRNWGVRTIEAPK